MTPTPTAPTLPVVAPARPAAIILDLLDRILRTYLQALVALLIPATALDVRFVTACAVAAVPAALTVVMNAASALAIPLGLPFYVDLLLRAVKTYVAAWLGFMIALPVFRLDYDSAGAAAAAAIPAVLSVIMAAIATRVGQRGTTRLLPASLDPEPVGLPRAV